jgi:hypothetical protein
LTHKNTLCLLLGNTPEDERREHLSQLTPEDWQTLHDQSHTQGLRPLLYTRLKPFFDQDLILADLQHDLRDAHIRTAYRNTLILHHAAILLKAIRKQNIPVIGLKGIYLVENISPNIAARPFGDIDLLVHKGDIPPVIKILEDLGYSMQTYFSLDDANLDIKHVPPMFNSDGLPVEVHWTILQEDEPFNIDPAGLWNRAISARIAGVDALALSPEDLLLHLCLHLGYQHHLSIGIRGLVDIVQVLDAFNGRLDWDQLIGTAREWGAEKPTWLTLTLAVDLINGAVPSEVLSDLQPEEPPTWILPQARATLLDERPAKVPMTPDLAALAEQKGIIGRLKVMLSRVFLPRRTMARLYGVPPNSVRIIGCYFKRAGQLIRWYGSAVGRIFRKDQRLLIGAEDQRAVDRLKDWMGKD